MKAIANVRAAFARTGSDIVAFAQWWIHELRDAYAWLFDRYGQKSPGFVLDLAATSGVLTPIGASPDQQLKFPLNQALPPLQDVFPNGAPVAAWVDLALPDGAVLKFQLRFPPLSDRALTGAIALQLEKELPLPAEQLFVDWRVLDKATDRSRLVEIALARSAQVIHWREQIQAWGWRARRIGLRGSDNELRFDFMPKPVRRLSLAMGRRELYLLGGVAVLSIAYALVIGGQWMYERNALRERISQAREQVSRVDELKASLAAESEPIIAFRSLMESPSAAGTLATMSRVLPRDGWLYQVDIRALARPATVAAEGYTPTATTLVQNLEPHFARVELLEVANAEAGGRLDRIKLKAILSAKEAR